VVAQHVLCFAAAIWVQAVLGAPAQALGLISSRPDSSSSALSAQSDTAAAWQQQQRWPVQQAGSVKAAGQHNHIAGSNSSSMQRRQSTPPLASLIGALQLQEAASDPQAAAYFSAQQNTRLHKQGSQKKHRGERGTFTSSGRSAINDNVVH
jgi:hypothetical protein